MSRDPKEGKPQHCGKKMQRLYIRKGTTDRKWITVGYYCTICRKMLKDSDLLLHLRSEKLFVKPDLVESISNPQKIILDIGEKLTKAGFGGEEKPRLIVDSILYFDKDNNSFIQKLDYVETEKIVKSQKTLFNEQDRTSLNLEVVELFLTHIFEALKVDPQEKSVLILEKCYKNNYVEYLYGRRDEINKTTLPEEIKENLKKKAKVEFINYNNFPRREFALMLFDSFRISRIYFSMGELLSVYANDSITGTVVNIGANSTRIIPVYEGFIITHAISVRNIGTNQVLEKIFEYLDIEKNYGESSIHSKYLLEKRIRLASEEYCYVSSKPIAEEKKWKDNEKLKKHIHLYNEKYAQLDQIRYLATEILFEKEELSTSKRKGTLVDALIETVQRSDIDLVKLLYGNILLVGGGSLYEGLEDRFRIELEQKIPKQIQFNIQTKPDRLITSWTGGSILSIMKFFNERNMWVTKAEYDEKGAAAVDRCI